MTFNKFKDYLFYLLPGALRKISTAKNCFYMLFELAGNLFDENKRLLFWEREQSMILTCDDELLPIHGIERDMPRLKDEPILDYRYRLLMKADIARTAGTNEGVKTAVKVLGFDNSYVQPYYEIDPTRWAEFIVWLRSSKRSQISLNDFEIIDHEVMKVKPASALPNYGVEFSSDIEINSTFHIGTLIQPLCGTFKCGTYPPVRSDLS